MPTFMNEGTRADGGGNDNGTGRENTKHWDLYTVDSAKHITAIWNHQESPGNATIGNILFMRTWIDSPCLTVTVPTACSKLSECPCPSAGVFCLFGRPPPGWRGRARASSCAYRAWCVQRLQLRLLHPWKLLLRASCFGRGVRQALLPPFHGAQQVRGAPQVVPGNPEHIHLSA